MPDHLLLGHRPFRLDPSVLARAAGPAARAAVPPLDLRAAAGERVAAVGADAPCYVCGHQGTDVRYSYHWRRPVCVVCMGETAGLPIGYLCEVRLDDGALCRAPARRKTRCATHRRQGPRVATEIAA